jgi:hypothetical protein
MGISSIKLGSTVCSLSNRSVWDKVLEQLKSYGGLDIYFQYAYHDLYALGESQVEAYSYQFGQQCFFLPYIKSPIDLLPGFFDIESAYGYGGPLSNSCDESFLKEAWDDFYKYAKQENIIAGFIRFHALLNNEQMASRVEFANIQPMNQVVILTLSKDEQAIWQGYSANTRNNIRSSQRKGVVIECKSDRQGLRIFQQMYYKTMDQLNAQEYYYFNDRYFDKIAQSLDGSYEVYLAVINGIYIGGALVLITDDFVYYHLSANLKDYRQYDAASLLRHSVIMAHLNGKRRILLFGGGKTAAVNDSLLIFKQGFSPERSQFYVGKMILDQEKYETLIAKWAKQFPTLVDQYKYHLLKYKYR